MGKDSSIQWCDHTFNPHRGCTKVSAGCTNCYASAMSKRNPAVLGTWGDNGTRIVASEAKWREPLAWDRAAVKAGERHRVFCASLADVFEDWQGQPKYSTGLPLAIDSIGGWDYHSPFGFAERPGTLDDVRDRLRSLIFATPNLDWLFVTKRPENYMRLWHDRSIVPENTWLGVSVENQEAADERIPILLSIPSSVRFLSVEPMLGPIRFGDLTGIDWVIFGGESGPHARPCNIEWIRDGVRQCREAGVNVFVKQLGSKPFCDMTGGNRYDDHTYFRLDDSHGGDVGEWSVDLRVREFPQPRKEVAR